MILRIPYKKPTAAPTPASTVSLWLCSPCPCRAAPTRARASLCSRCTLSGPLDGRTGKRGGGGEEERRRCAAVARGPGWLALHRRKNRRRSRIVLQTRAYPARSGGGLHRRRGGGGLELEEQQGRAARHKGRVSLAAILCAAKRVRASVIRFLCGQRAPLPWTGGTLTRGTLIVLNYARHLRTFV